MNQEYTQKVLEKYTFFSGDLGICAISKDDLKVGKNSFMSLKEFLSQELTAAYQQGYAKGSDTGIEDTEKKILNQYGDFRKYVKGKKYSQTLRFFLLPHTE